MPEKPIAPSFNFYVKQKALFRAVYGFFEGRKLLLCGVTSLLCGATNHLNGDTKLLCGVNDLIPADQNHLSSGTSLWSDGRNHRTSREGKRLYAWVLWSHAVTMCRDHTGVAFCEQSFQLVRFPIFNFSRKLWIDSMLSTLTISKSIATSDSNSYHEQSSK